MAQATRYGLVGLAVAAAVTTGILAGPASAETMTMKTMLSGAQQVPPVTTGGRGEVDTTYDTATKTLTWRGTYTGLSGPATAAHFHGPAALGANAGVAIPAPAPASPFMGSAVLTDAQATALTEGRMYFNIHTAANPGGEIRGQVTK